MSWDIQQPKMSELLLLNGWASARQVSKLARSDFAFGIGDKVANRVIANLGSDGHAGLSSEVSTFCCNAGRRFADHAWHAYQTKKRGAQQMTHRILRDAPASRQNGAETFGLSVRTMNVIRMVVAEARGYSDKYSFSEEPQIIARRTAEAGRESFEGIGNCGKKTIAEIEAWIGKYGFRWWPQIDLDENEYSEGA